MDEVAPVAAGDSGTAGPQVPAWSCDADPVTSSADRSGGPAMQMPVAHSAPEGLPELRAGAHLTPEDGACLMEYVSVLAGTAFNDHPRCTDPTLATVARLVNDTSTDAGRPLLAAFAPLLAETGSTRDARRTAAVIRATVLAAHAAAGDTAGLRRLVRGAERRYDRVTGSGPLSALARNLDTLHRYGAGRRRLERSLLALRELPEPRRDPALRAALAAALAAALPPTRSPVVDVPGPTPTASTLPPGRSSA
jgi:hypothetical protein